MIRIPANSLQVGDVLRIQTDVEIDDHPVMAEPPDFEQIARAAVMMFYNTTPRHSADERESVAKIAEQLRQVYQRGLEDAADVVDDALSLPPGAGFTRGQISDAIRAHGGLPAKWTAKMADRIINRAITIYRHAIFPNASAEKDRAALIDDLRHVWNARGAADIEAVDAVGDRRGVPELLEVNAIRSLDR